VVPPDADKRWEYRRPAVERISRAVGKMLMERAKVSPSSAMLGHQLVANLFQQLLGHPRYVRSSALPQKCDVVLTDDSKIHYPDAVSAQAS